MRRLLLTAASAVLIAAPIPVALAQTGPDTEGQTTADLVKKHRFGLALHKEARAQMKAAKRRAKAKKAAATEAAAVTTMPAHLAAIAQCESGGNPQAIGGGGMYRGAFQFSMATWAAVGGTGDPAAAPMSEQIKRAQILYETSGPGQWPVCGS
jgi:hypothetical protein